MTDVRKSIMEDVGQNQLVAKEISFQAPIRKSNYKSFSHVMQKIQTTKKDGSVKEAEVNRNILGALNS